MHAKKNKGFTKGGVQHLEKFQNNYIIFCVPIMHVQRCGFEFMIQGNALTVSECDFIFVFSLTNVILELVILLIVCICF